jgi:hypothetical protein
MKRNDGAKELVKLQNKKEDLSETLLWPQHSSVIVVHLMQSSGIF